VIAFFAIFFVVLFLIGGFVLHQNVKDSRKKKLLGWIQNTNFDLSVIGIRLKIKEPGYIDLGGYSVFDLLADQNGVYLLDKKCKRPIIFLNDRKPEHVRYFTLKFSPYFFDIENDHFIIKGSMAYRDFLSIGVKELKIIFESPKEISEALKIAKIKTGSLNPNGL